MWSWFPLMWVWYACTSPIVCVVVAGHPCKLTEVGWFPVVQFVVPIIILVFNWFIIIFGRAIEWQMSFLSAFLAFYLWYPFWHSWRSLHAFLSTICVSVPRPIQYLHLRDLLELCNRDCFIVLWETFVGFWVLLNLALSLRNLFVVLKRDRKSTRLNSSHRT